MAVCCKPTENVATQSPTTNSPGRFLQDSSTGDPMHSQIGYKNGFRMPEEIQSFKWQNQPFVKLEVDHEQPNSLCNLTELTGIDPICSSMLSDELASTFEFMEHRPTSNKPCDRPYFEVESNFSVATRPSYCGTYMHTFSQDYYEANLYRSQDQSWFLSRLGSEFIHTLTYPTQ